MLKKKNLLGVFYANFVGEAHHIFAFFHYYRSNIDFI